MADNLREERLKILELLQEGKITPDQAESLLSALSKNASEEETVVVSTKKPAFRNLKIYVDSSEGEKVRVNIPIEFARLLKKGKFGNVNVDDYDIDLDSVIEMVNSGVVGEIVSIDTEDGDHVKITVE